MTHLTYADRELLLQTFDALKDAWKGSDEHLLAEACEWAKQLAPSFGFEHALTRDVAVLSRYLVDRKDDRDLADIARGGLLYVLTADAQGPTRLGDFGLLDDAFVSSYAVHEIRTRLSDVAAYNPPRLAPNEQDRAERLFLEFIEQPLLEDFDVVLQARRFGESLAHLTASGLFRRLRKNIEFLSGVLADQSRSDEQRSYARAALNYIACEQDAIDDRLGIVGYLDDNFIAQLAVDLIEPNREPWLELLDATVGNWPFLNGLFLDEGVAIRPISEYMIINSALSCPELRRGSDASLALLVVPISGPTPFLLGFLAALGLVQESGQRNVTEATFRVGQKVLVDHSAIAEFVGFDTCNGRRMFKLRQFRTERNQRLQSIHYWPISDLRRLIPADWSRATRGELTHDLSRSEAPLPALEYLFNASKTAELSTVAKRVLVVMPAASAHDMATRLRLHGDLLKNVIPMGHLSGDGSVKAWSNRFGQQSPLLLFASDLDEACAYAEERSEQIKLTVVDAAGRNAKKMASLRRLHQFRLRTLIVCAERYAEDVNLEGDGIGVWEWREDDFASLLWPAETNESSKGPVARYERKLQSRSCDRPKVETIPFEVADSAFESVRRLRAHARARGDDHLAELDELVLLSYGLITRMLRSATPLTTSMPSVPEIEADLSKLSEIERGSRYLTEEERSAVSHAQQSLCGLFSTLQTDNPKATIVRQLLTSQGRLGIICPDLRLCPDLEIAYSGLDTQIRSGYVEDGDRIDGAVIPGWFRQDRMAALLLPPVTTPMYLVLYDIEQKWYAAFRRERQTARAARSARGGRPRLFPGVEGWRQPETEPSEPATTDPSASLDELDAIQRDARTSYRQRLYKSARSDGTETEVPARLVLFSGAAYAFLTESYRANVVTQLLEDAVEEQDETADVKQKGVSQLRLSDALLFHRGSARDVIRTAADELLPHGVRDTSSLWRTALLDYASRQGLTHEQVHLQLQQCGCPLTQQTIKIWLENENVIAPQAYKRDVAVIAKVTGDQSLARNMDSVLSAIRDVRSAHLRASHALAKRVMAQAVNVLKEEGQATSLIQLDANVVVVRIVEIDSELTQVRISWTNRLLEGESWHE